MVRLPTARLALEFSRLRWHNFPLALLVDRLAAFVRDGSGRDIVVTSIFRSPELQRTVYGRGTKKVGPSFEVAALGELGLLGASAGSDFGERDRALLRTASPHMAWLGVDVATRFHAPDEVDAMVGFVRRWDPYNRLPVIGASGSRTIWLHEAGTREPHLHLQYKGPAVHAV